MENKTGGCWYWARKFCNEESGQGVVEYGAVLVLVSIAAILILNAISENVKARAEYIEKEVTGI